MAKVGRKGKYEEWLTEDALKRVEGWARDGLSDEQICKNMRISKDTFYRWVNTFAEFSDALKRGKAPVDFEVENALLKTALGHTVTLKKPIKVKIEKQLSGKGKIVEEHIEYAEEEVYIPPQAVAQIFWLKNRRPDKWRDRPLNGADTAELPDDGFIDALKGTAAKDWEEDEDSADIQV